MRKVIAAAIQMSVPETLEQSVEKAVELTKKAAEMGANVVLLPELFETKYFCQERRYESYKLACATEDDLAVKRFSEVTKELSLVMPISFFERDGNVLYNSIAVLDSGKLGIERCAKIIWSAMNE